MRHLFMGWAVIFVVAWGSVAPLRASEPASSPTLIVRVATRDPAVIADLARRHSHVLIAKEKGVVIFESDAAEVAALGAEGLSVTLDEQATAAQRTSMTLAPGQINGIPGFPCYRTVTETNARLDQLLLQHPTRVRMVDIGDSWERFSGGGAGAGEDLRVIVLGNQEIAGPKPKAFVMTGLHAREYTPVELGLRTVEWLLENYGRNADATWLIDHQELHVLVQSNPDGRKRAEQATNWRKNTNAAYCPNTRRGADLNRNFPFEWGAHNGSSGAVCDDTYRGPLATSEPETRAVVDYVRSQFPDVRGPLATDGAPVTTPGLFFDIHSFSRLVLWPWGYTNQAAANGPAMETLGRRFAWFNDYAPQQAIDLYVTDGTTDDFAYGELGLAAYTFELGNQFFESCSVFEADVYPDNFAALVYALKVTRAPYLLPSGPEARNLTVAPDLALTGEAVVVSGTLDDTRFNQSLGGSEPSHAIAQANLYARIAPWQAGAAAVPALASDGAFDEAVESVTGQFAGGTLPAGKHVIYLQGRDASGLEGPVSAGFTEVRAPADVATVTGRVTDARTLAPVASASVRASGYVSTGAADGRYSRRVPAGTHVFEIEAFNYERLVVNDVLAPGGSSVTRDFALYPLCEVLHEDAESGAAGWTLQSPWAIALPNAAHTSRFFTDSPAGNYASNANISTTSPLFSMAGYTIPVLTFESRCDTEAGFDFGRVEVRTDAAGLWREVFRCDNAPAWRTERVEIPEFADAPTAQLRFRFTSDSGVNRDGWSVDNISLSAGGPTCRAQVPSVGLFSNGFE